MFTSESFGDSMTLWILDADFVCWGARASVFAANAGGILCQGALSVRSTASASFLPSVQTQKLETVCLTMQLGLDYFPANNPITTFNRSCFRSLELGQISGFAKESDRTLTASTFRISIIQTYQPKYCKLIGTGSIVPLFQSSQRRCVDGSIL